MRFKILGWIVVCVMFLPNYGHATRGEFDVDRWYEMLDSVRERAVSESISDDIIKSTMRSPAFIPSIVKSDKNQAEFKLTLDGYLSRTVNPTRIAMGQKMRANIQQCYRVLKINMAFLRILCWRFGEWNQTMARLNRVIN